MRQLVRTFGLFLIFFFISFGAKADWCLFNCPHPYSIRIPIPEAKPVKSLEGLTDALGACQRNPKLNAYNNINGDLYSIAIEPAVRARYRTLKTSFAQDKTPIPGRLVRGHFVADDPRVDADLRRHPNKYRQSMFTKESNGEFTEITEDEFVAMDVLARTLVGEMGTARCQPHRTYMGAVARVLLNRAEEAAESASAERRFCRSSCDENDSFPRRIKGISVARKQFSMWNKLGDTPRDERDEQIRLQRRVFCPKSVDLGGDPEIWKWAANVAMLTVLAPKKLKVQSQGLRSFYYTSGMAFKYGVELKDPRVNGQTISNNSCLRFWAERSTPPPAPARAAARPVAKKKPRAASR